MRDAMTPERLDEIRERANLQCGLDGDDADDLLEHVDHLTAELATARTAWDEWKTSSRAGHAHASDMADEVARLREGIEAISSVSWDVVHPSWVKHMCRDLLKVDPELGARMAEIDARRRGEP